MNRIIKRVICLIVLLVISNQTFAQDKVRNIYVMLDVDGTITTRIDPSDIKTIEKVEKAGFHCYRLKFLASKNGDPKFYSWYSQMLKNEELRKEQKLRVKMLGDNIVEIEEVVVLRPAIQNFLEKLDQLNNKSVSIKFFIASRNDDIHNQNLIDHLTASINGMAFKDKVKLVIPEKVMYWLMEVV